MAVKPITVQNFKGGLNLSTISDIGDNQFSIAENMFYNKKGQIQTRYGIKNFGNAVGTNKPITSYFFFQRDDTQATLAVCNSGTKFYKYVEATGNWTEVKTGLTEFETAPGYTTHRTRRDYAVYKNIIYMTNGIDPYAGYDGTTYSQYGAQPKVRYINMNTDRLYGAGEDINPSTIYYTGAAPANGQTINTSSVVVGGDELGRINGLTEYGQLMLAVKNSKVFSIDVVNAKALPVDAEQGGYSDRCIANINNSIVYLTSRGFDVLKTRYGVTGSSAVNGDSLDRDVSTLSTQILPINMNSNCAFYIDRTSNYIASFAVNSDVPNTTLVYNEGVKAWTQYTYPNIYDLGFYIDTAGVYHYLASSGTSDQMYEIESGFTDLGELIAHHIKTKAFDFGEPGSYKTVDRIDIIGEKNKGYDIITTIEADGETVGGGTITDSAITSTVVSQALGDPVLGVDKLTGPTVNDDVVLYNFFISVPLYITGTNFAIDMASNGGSWIINKIRLRVNGEPMDVIGDDNIII